MFACEWFYDEIIICFESAFSDEKKHYINKMYVQCICFCGVCEKILFICMFLKWVRVDYAKFSIKEWFYV